VTLLHFSPLDDPPLPNVFGLSSLLPLSSSEAIRSVLSLPLIFLQLLVSTVRALWVPPLFPSVARGHSFVTSFPPLLTILGTLQNPIWPADHFVPLFRGSGGHCFEVCPALFSIFDFLAFFVQDGHSPRNPPMRPCGGFPVILFTFEVTTWASLDGSMRTVFSNEPAEDFSWASKCVSLLGIQLSSFSPPLINLDLYGWSQCPGQRLVEIDTFSNPGALFTFLPFPRLVSFFWGGDFLGSASTSMLELYSFMLQRRTFTPLQFRGCEGTPLSASTDSNTSSPALGFSFLRRSSCEFSESFLYCL